jgi:transposase
MEKEEKVPIINPHACGIDVGSRQHFVAINQNREDVNCFGVYTKDHQEMIAMSNADKADLKSSKPTMS